MQLAQTLCLEHGAKYGWDADNGFIAYGGSLKGDVFKV